MKIKFKIIALVVIATSILVIGCESSDGNDSNNENTGRIEITDNTVENDPVDSADYWNDGVLVWSEEFAQPKLSDQNWSFATNVAGSDNSEWQNYRNENVEVVNGTLQIVAKKVGAGQKKGDYTSSRITSKYAFTYGRIEVRAKVPQEEKNGIWSKIAMVGDNENIVGWPNSGEINLMEYLSHNSGETYITVHSGANNDANGTLISAATELPTIEEEFHIYGLLWTDRYLKFYIDEIDNITYSFRRPSEYSDENWPFSKPFYLLAGMAVGGKYGGLMGVDDSMFPATMEIEYIRVYHAK